MSIDMLGLSHRIVLPLHFYEIMTNLQYGI